MLNNEKSKKIKKKGQWKNVMNNKRKHRLFPQELIDTLNLAKKLEKQEQSDNNKIYSLHEQHVECISKEKAHKNYKFGFKLSVATTSKKVYSII